MGSTKDPEDGGAVAGAVFGAVAIYAVCTPTPPSSSSSENRGLCANDMVLAGLLRVLRFPGFPAYAGVEKGDDKSVKNINDQRYGNYRE